DRHLTDRALITCQFDLLIQQTRRLVSARDPIEFDPSPSRRWLLMDGLEHLLAAPSQGDEVNSEKIELVQIGIGRQLRVEDQFLRDSPRALAPVLDKAQDLVI